MIFPSKGDGAASGANCEESYVMTATENQNVREDNLSEATPIPDAKLDTVALLSSPFSSQSQRNDSSVISTFDGDNPFELCDLNISGGTSDVSDSGKDIIVASPQAPLQGAKPVDRTGVQTVLREFNLVDWNGDGELSQKEITRTITDQVGSVHTQEVDYLAEISRNFDRIMHLHDDKNGKDAGISANDLNRFDSILMAANFARKNYFAIDTNGNGTISTTEIESYRNHPDAKNPTDKSQLERLSRDLTAMASIVDDPSSSSELSYRDMTELLSMGKNLDVPGVHDAIAVQQEDGVMGTFVRRTYDAFDSIDQNQNGALSLDEAASTSSRYLRRILAAEHQSIGSVSKDTISNFGITRNDLQQLVRDTAAVHLSDNFGRIDIDDTGLISKKELKHTIESEQHQLDAYGSNLSGYNQSRTNSAREGYIEALNFSLENFGQIASTHGQSVGISKEDIFLTYDAERNVRHLDADIRAVPRDFIPPPLK